MSSGVARTVARTVARAVAHRTARRSVPRATRTRPQPYRPRQTRCAARGAQVRRAPGGSARDSIAASRHRPSHQHSIREKQIPAQRLGPTTNPDTHGQHRTQDQPRAEHTLVSLYGSGWPSVRSAKRHRRLLNLGTSPTVGVDRHVGGELGHDSEVALEPGSGQCPLGGRAFAADKGHARSDGCVRSTTWMSRRLRGWSFSASARPTPRQADDRGKRLLRRCVS
jgi:hypothetical protein